MKCPSCGFSNPEGMRFCGQCATPLANLCAACGFENPAGFKFCGSCGQALSGEEAGETGRPAAEHRTLPIAEPEVERRNITVLFADLTGFTALSEKLDPEDVYRTINRYLQVLVERVKKYEGTVDKFTGDGLIALFGAPVAHENDPERAVRAALEIQAELAEASEQIEHELGVTLKARIGINTGTAITGSVGSDLARDQYTALGDTVNVASRLQAAATPGSVWVSESTHRLTHPFFSSREIGPLKVKGREEAVVAYEILESKHGTASVRGVRGLRAPLIGRTEELLTLTSPFKRVASAGAGHAILVTGEAGVGKSRLVREALGAPGLEALRVFRAVAAAHDRSTAYAMTRSLLRSGFQLSESWTAATQSERIRGRLKALDLDPREHLPLLESALGLPISLREGRDRLLHLHAAQIRQQTFLTVRQWLASETRESPPALVLDDLHWSDRLSLDLLLFLLPLIEESSLVFVCASRPNEGQAADRIDEFGRTRLGGRYTRLDLQDLTPEDSQELLRRLLNLNALPPALERLVVERAEGNPFFLEELIGVLVDRGVLYQEARRWAFRADVDTRTLEIPATLDGLIMSRVDLLEIESRHALQAAAVIGREFDSALVSHISDGPSNRTTPEIFSSLEERGFIVRSLEDGRRDYAFAHGLIRETVYERLLRARRKELHLKAGDAILRLYPNASDEQPEVLAEHYYLSTEPLRALGFALAAGHRARERFANQDALQFYGWAQELLESGGEVHPDDKQRLYVGLGDVQNFLGEYEAAVESYQAAIELVNRNAELADIDQIADITRRIGRSYERRGTFDEALWWLRLALSHLDEAGQPEDSVTRARVYNDLGWVAFHQGQQETAHYWFSRGLGILEGTDHFNELASVYNRLAASYWSRGDWETASDFAQRGLAVREAAGDTGGIANSLNQLGIIAYAQGAWQASEEHFQRALTIYSRGLYQEAIAVQYSNLGLLHLGMGKFDEAEGELKQSLAISEKIGNDLYACRALNNLAQLEWWRGNFGDALERVGKALALAEKVGDKEQRSEGSWIQAQALLSVGDLEQARNSMRLSLELAREIKDQQNEGAALRALGTIERQEGEWEAAKTNLISSVQIFRNLKVRFEAAKSQLELGILYRTMARPGGRDSGLLEEASVTLNSALETFEEIGARHLLALAQDELARLESLKQKSGSDA